ncbi:restriction endonuclease subunit S [Aeromonas caviae]|uniref:restriction endonuclease subunit S n=1 Tax=Aeromonas caviae TaxID=648 RepID=UPI00244A9048|nr:restriction endonuclease subunit S [Aeromonas caviae]MDH0241240.1 restriction endonuclease subunit S [Aeromonas caviae]
MVPKGWSRSQIGEIANVQVGRDLIEDRYSEIESEKYKYPVYSNTVENRGLYGFYDFPEYPGNAVTVVGRGIGLGTAFARYENSAFGAIGRLLVLTPKINSFDVGFLADYINFSLIIHNESGGIPQLPGASLSKYLVTLPPLPEQQKIAKILSTWDKAISTTEQLLANSQQQKKALMQQLLTGKKRLLDKNGVRFSGEWKKVTLDSVADMNSGGTPKSSIEEYYGGDIPWVSIADMTKHGKWISSTERNISELGLANSSARLYPENTILYAMYASIGECSIAKVPLCSSQAILGIRPKKSLYFEFLYFFLVSLKDEIKLQGQQGTQANLNAGMVKGFSLRLPCIEEQQKIADVLSTTDQEIAALQQKLDALKQEKKALMQQLLTGKRRVKVEEAA